MSQAGIMNTAAGPVPPTVATTYVTNVNSPAIPAANVLDVFGASTTANNLFGIQTDGSSGGNVLTVQLTNRAFGAIGTMDATPATAINFPMAASATVYVLDGLITAHNTTDAAGAGYFFSAAARTDGVTGTLISSPQFGAEFEEVAMAAADIAVTVVGNNIRVVVTGIAGKAIDWLAQFTYSQVV